MLDKLERKLGKYAIPRLMNWFIAGYVIGYILEAIDASSGSDIISLMTLEPYYILHGQIWRIITWVMIPPAQNIIFAIIMIIFYWQLGRALEQVWGTFRFNVYMFGGMIITVIAAIILYLVAWAVTGNQMISLGNYFSTDYINLSIFLAFALTFPVEIVLLYFFIPVKMKWMAYLYLIFVAIDVIQAIGMGMAGIPIIVAIAASLLNFLIYFLLKIEFSFYLLPTYSTVNKFISTLSMISGMNLDELTANLSFKVSINSFLSQSSKDMELQYMHIAASAICRPIWVC